MSKRKIHFNSEKLLSFSAMTISFITLLIFIYQTNLMSRQHNTSIMPYLEISTSTSSETYSFKLELENHGVGPAIIESITMSYKGEQHDLRDYDNHLFNYLSSIWPDFERIKAFSSATLDRGMAIPANTSYHILQVKDSMDFNTFVPGLEQLLNNGLEYDIIYKSIQGERWRIDELSEGPEKL